MRFRISVGLLTDIVPKMFVAENCVHRMLNAFEIRQNEKI